MSSLSHPMPSVPPSPAIALPSAEEIGAWRDWLTLPSGDPLYQLARSRFAMLGGGLAESAPPPPAPPAIAGATGSGQPSAPIPFARFRAEVLALYQPPFRASATRHKMRFVLDQVALLIGPDATTADLTPTLIGRFVQSRPAAQSNNTTLSYLGALRAVCGYAVACGYLPASPFAFRNRNQWVRPSVPKRKSHHSLEEIRRVLDLARAEIGTMRPGSWDEWRARRLYALAATVAYTGLRKREALCLRVEDIDLRERMIVVVARVGNRLKTEAAAQPVPMPLALAVVLTQWLPCLALPKGLPATKAKKRPDAAWVFPNSRRTGPWDSGGIGARALDHLIALGKRAGVEGFTFQSLRHSWATHAESAWGFSETMIQRVLRHTSTQTQRHYRHADSENLRSAVGDLRFGEGEDRPSPPVIPAFVRPSPAPSKLTPEVRAEIKQRYAQGETYQELRAAFGLSTSTVCRAVRGHD